MKIKLTDVKFKIGNNLIAPNNIFRLCVENGRTEIGYYDNTDGYAKRIEMAAPAQDVEIVVPEVQEGERGGY